MDYVHMDLTDFHSAPYVTVPRPLGQPFPGLPMHCVSVATLESILSRDRFDGFGNHLGRLHAILPLMSRPTARSGGGGSWGGGGVPGQPSGQIAYPHPMGQVLPGPMPQPQPPGGQDARRQTMHEAQTMMAAETDFLSEWMLVTPEGTVCADRETARKAIHRFVSRLLLAHQIEA